MGDNMSEKIEENYLELLDKKIEKYKKLNQTIYMIVSVKRAMKNGDGITVELLKNQLLSNFEELSELPLYSSLKNLLNYKKMQEDYLLSQCQGDRERRSKIVYADNLEYLINKSEIEDYYYNLLTMCYTDQYGWWHEILKSNLDLERLSDLYINTLISTFRVDEFINYTEYIEKNISDKIFKRINEDTNIKNEVFKTLAYQRPSIIETLQNRGLVNFSYATIEGKSAIVYMFENDQLDVFKSLYNGLSQEDKQRVISWALLSCFRSKKYLNNLMKLDFKLTEDLVTNFTDKAAKYIDHIAWDGGIEGYRNDVSDLLIRKASNKKEYKEYKKYVNDFLDKTDYSKIMEERQKEIEKKQQEQQLLNAKRSEFSTLLYNLNDKLQEEVPGKTRIKNIKLKK